VARPHAKLRNSCAYFSEVALKTSRTSETPSDPPGRTSYRNGQKTSWDTNSAVSLEDGKYGRRAVLASEWSDQLIGYFASNDVAELELNQAKGWKGQDLSFLDKLPGLKSFEIFDFNIRDIQPIHHLHKLRRLGVTTYCSTRIDFTAFPELESCGLEWRPKAASLFECVTLKGLFVNRYSGKDADPFGKLVNLESLAILNAPVANLHGLSTLTKLRSLRLANLKRLASLAGIEGLVNLEELEIHTCRAIGSIKEIGSLLRLKKLLLNNDGDIESLTPLEKLNGLEWITFYESTNIVDGNLGLLARQKHLSRIAFRNRRHYSHKSEQLRELITR
jgi:hypothetical protein